MGSHLGGRLSSYLESQREPMLELLERLVRAESPSADRVAQGPVLDTLARSLADLGFETRRLSGRLSGGHLYAATAERRRRPVQLLLGHCDTVWPRGTLAGMPWEVDGDVARGPGVYDMKAGLVQGIFALKALTALRLEPAVAPIFFVNSDEEVGSRESRHHIERLARRAERAFVLEPSLGRRGRLKTARKGVGRYTVRIRGRAAHAGLDPGRGASAILELSHVIQKLFALNDPERGVTVNVGKIDGGLAPNVVAPESLAVTDVRVRTAADAERVAAAIAALEPETPGVRLEVEGRFGRPPMEPTPRNRALWQRARDHAGALGVALEEGLAGGGSDGSFTSCVTATLDGLGAVGDGAHAAHEFIYVSKMAERSALLGLLLLDPPAAAGR